MPPQTPPYAESDDTATMRRDCRVAAVRLGLVDPLDRAVVRAVVVRAPERGRAAYAAPTVDAAADLAARLGLAVET